jgi:hypothetical protein
MRFLFDKCKKLTNCVDDFWIEMAGREVLYYEVFDSEEDASVYEEDKPKMFKKHPEKLYAFYEVPLTWDNQFGIDSDELMLELGFNAVHNKLHHCPKLGSRIVIDDGSEWRIVLRKRKNSSHNGNGRLFLLAKRYQECQTDKSQPKD